MRPTVALSLPHVVCLLALAASAGAQTAPTARWNAAERGAVADGSTDCTAAIQAVLDEAGKAGGGIVELPAGRYRVNGNLSIPANVTLQGTYRVPPTVRRNEVAEMTGSVLLAYAGRGKPEDPPFIRLAGNCANLAGLIVYYPEWRRADVPPAPYPPCVLSMDTENVGVQDCCFVNPYEAIKLVRAHRHLVRNVTGYPIRRGIFVDECYDIGHIENIHFWPFGVVYRADDPYCLWINTNGVAFELARTDWHYVLNTFCFGYGVGYLFSESRSGSTNGNFLGLGADSCQRAVVVEQAQAPGLLITNGEFVGRWSSTDAVTVDIGPRVTGKVSLQNCSFWGPIDRCVVMRAGAGQFTASGCNFVSWDQRHQQSPAIQIDAGAAIVQGCTFGPGDVHVRVAKGVRSAIVMGCQADAGVTVENQAGERAQLVANQPDPVRWTAAARARYAIDVGSTGDSRYLRRWYAPERVPVEGRVRTQRWSTPASSLSLPVAPGRAYTLRLELTVPAGARAADAGLYLGGLRLATLPRGDRLATITASLPPSAVDRVTLALRCKGWVPRTTLPGSQDDRELGLAVYRATMTARGSSGRTFNANTGEWLP